MQQKPLPPLAGLHCPVPQQTFPVLVHAIPASLKLHCVGANVGFVDGVFVGLSVVGFEVGTSVSGLLLGESDGLFDGFEVGTSVSGLWLGDTVGSDVSGFEVTGLRLGDLDGLEDSGFDVVGLKMGARLGSGESSFVTPHTSVLLSAKLKQPKLPIIPLDSLQQSGSVALMAVQFNPTALMQVLGEAGPAEQPCTVFEQP